MSIKKLRTLALLIAVLSTAAVCQAQGQSSPPPTDNYVTNSGFKNRVFDVRNRAPEDLVPVIKLLTSGFKGAQLSASNAFRTITVRDFPENIAAIDDAIKRLDTPEATRPDIELRMHVLLASNKESTPGQYPADLKDVITELKTTLAYKDYTLLTSIVQRTRESRGSSAGYVQGRGSSEMAWPSQATGASEKRLANYSFDANSVSLTSTSSGTIDVQLGNFNFSLSVPGSEARIHSDLSLRVGEKVVVGTAGFSDKALILVMTAKVIK
jgi:type II secretory pathway component GspD/PulD (secretin)